MKKWDFFWGGVVCVLVGFFIRASSSDRFQLPRKKKESSSFLCDLLFGVVVSCTIAVLILQSKRVKREITSMQEVDAC